MPGRQRVRENVQNHESFAKMHQRVRENEQNLEPSATLCLATEGTGFLDSRKLQDALDRPRASWSVRLRLQTLSVQFSCSRICTRRLQVAARWEAAANFRTVWRWEARKSRNPVPFVARHNVAEGSRFCAFSRTLWRILAKGS